MPPGQKSPDYLLLHKKNDFELFSLLASCPTIKTKDELKTMGFNPHGDIYLCFCIDKKVDIEIIKLNEIEKQTIKETVAPFIMQKDSCFVGEDAK